MSSEQDRQEVIRLIRQYTDEKTATKKLARDALITEGIYTASGELAESYGGKESSK